VRLRTLLPLLLALTALAGCLRREHNVQAIIGGTLIDGTPRPPIEKSVVLVVDGRVAAMDRAGAVKIPAGARRVEVWGRFVFPASPSTPLVVGNDADLLILNVNPALDIDYTRHVVGRMELGRWSQYPQ
jgi:imidazolonepropionase-like amidohydrolase